MNGNSYSGSSTFSAGILIYGDTGEFCLGIQVVQNTLAGNDVGIYAVNDDNGLAPTIQTNIKLVNNDISNDALQNGYVYQAGITSEGNNDKIINNNISGLGYDPNTYPGSTFFVDADPSFAIRAKIHANK